MPWLKLITRVYLNPTNLKSLRCNFFFSTRAFNTGHMIIMQMLFTENCEKWSGDQITIQHKFNGRLFDGPFFTVLISSARPQYWAWHVCSEPQKKDCLNAAASDSKSPITKCTMNSIICNLQTKMFLNQSSYMYIVVVLLVYLSIK